MTELDETNCACAGDDAQAEAGLEFHADVASSSLVEKSEAPAEDDVDPLDAFMVDNSAQLVKEELQPEAEIDPLDAFMTSQVLPRAKLAVAPQIAITSQDTVIPGVRPVTAQGMRIAPVKPAARRRAVRRRFSSGESSSEDDEASSEEEDDAVRVQRLA